MDKVIILLATYNGAKYVNDQIDSILKQTYTNWQLVIRDDYSSDKTSQILTKYQVAYPEKIVIVDNSNVNLGSTLNFNALLQLAKNEKYIMFCDQDDFWVSDKIEYTLNEMIILEKKYGDNFPLLVHTNFHYVDYALNKISSKENFRATKIPDLSLPHFLVQNPVYGCTAMINRSLADTIGSIPSIAESHDYWIAMVASAFGKISYLNKKTVLYRQHDGNISGSFRDSSFTNRFKRIFFQKVMFEKFIAKVYMAIEFKNIYIKYLSDEQKDLIDNFIKLSKNKSPSLFYKNVRNGVRKQTLSQTFLLYISILLLKDQHCH